MRNHYLQIVYDKSIMSASEDEFQEYLVAPNQQSMSEVILTKYYIHREKNTSLFNLNSLY